MREPGWYQDPQDADRLRYWDGKAWVRTKPRSQLVGAGEKLQSTGQRVSKAGSGIMWILIGLAALLLIFLLL